MLQAGLVAFAWAKQDVTSAAGKSKVRNMNEDHAYLMEPP